jgi:hypothetical protein
MIEAKCLEKRANSSGTHGPILGRGGRGLPPHHGRWEKVHEVLSTLAVRYSLSHFDVEAVQAPFEKEASRPSPSPGSSAGAIDFDT